MATKTAIVFAGGGSLGAVQVGMLQALVEANVRFDLVVGASVGAINGAYFAARPDPTASRRSPISGGAYAKRTSFPCPGSIPVED
jgi:predicted acylesterase/phospholipase RssA